MNFSSMTDAEDDAAKKALNDARALARSGEFEKALERHEWFHKNALSINPSYYGVRLSFALGDWKDLGDKYPPALASLKSMRDEGVKALFAGTATPDVFHDISSINRALGEDESTVKVFKELHSHYPELAVKCFQMVQETLLAKHEINLFLHYVGDLPSYMQAQIDLHENATGYMKSRYDPHMESSLKHFDDQLVSTALQLIQIAEKKDDPAAAEKIREMTAKIIADPRLRSAK